MIAIIGRVANKRDTTANWTYVNPVLLNGEIGLDTTIKNFKVGDGVTHWASLPYWIPTSTPSQIVTPITGGVTPNPITVAHTGMTYPDVLLLTPDGHEYSGATWQDDGTSIILTGDSDGSGHFADSFTFVISGAVGGSSSSSGSLTRSDTDLLSDGMGGYYLPLILPTGLRPFYAESNGVEVKVNYNMIDYSPAALLGFPNNTPGQVILVKYS